MYAPFVKNLLLFIALSPSELKDIEEKYKTFKPLVGDIKTESEWYKANLLLVLFVYHQTVSNKFSL